MVRVDHTRIRGVRRFDPFAGRVSFVERYCDDRETETFEFLLECLPPGQVISAASPTRPNNQHLFLAPDRRHGVRNAMNVVQGEVGGSTVAELLGNGSR